MITLYQHPASPFCITIAAILRVAKADHRVVNLPYSDRRPIVEKSRGQYYKVPLLEDGDRVIWEQTDYSQDIARYLDRLLTLDLFPPALDGLQTILARYIESEVESIGFKLNDIYYEEWLPDLYDRTMMVRHKERKFGPGCLGRWAADQADLRREFEMLLLPLDQMLSQRACLADDWPRFVDFDLFGILGNANYTGRNPLPSSLTHLVRWHDRMRKAIAEAIP